MTGRPRVQIPPGPPFTFDVLPAIESGNTTLLRMDSQKLSHDDCSTMPIVRSTSTCRILVLCLLRLKKKLFSLLGSQWWMEDSSGHEIAKVSGNIWEHDYRVETPADAQIAQIHKKWISVRDSYCVEITNPEIKPFLVLSYVIAMDHVE